MIEIDGASHTGVDDIRDLREKVSRRPAEGRRKVYIIDEVHMLSTSAFNALLKTLEEPPPHVIFVLATTDPHKIPATVLSRCQRFDLKPIATTDLVRHLRTISEREQLEVDDAALEFIARSSIVLVDNAVNKHVYRRAFDRKLREEQLEVWVAISGSMAIEHTAILLMGVVELLFLQHASVINIGGYELEDAMMGSNSTATTALS